MHRINFSLVDFLGSALVVYSLWWAVVSQSIPDGLLGSNCVWGVDRFSFPLWRSPWVGMVDCRCSYYLFISIPVIIVVIVIIGILSVQWLCHSVLWSVVGSPLPILAIIWSIIRVVTIAPVMAVWCISSCVVIILMVRSVFLCSSITQVVCLVFVIF